MWRGRVWIRLETGLRGRGVRRFLMLPFGPYNLMKGNDMPQRCGVVLGILLASVVSAEAETLTFEAPTGTVQSTMVTTGILAGGGVHLNPVGLGSCYFGSTCRFGGEMTYALADGVTGELSNVSGVMAPVAGGGNEYTVTAAASGTDSEGRAVKATFTFLFSYFCRRGCSRTYAGGVLTLVE